MMDRGGINLETFTVSVLLRKDEYCAAAAYRLPIIGWGIPTGLLLMLCGVTVWIVDLGAAITWSFLLMGVVFALFDGLFAPMLGRTVFAARYDRRRPEAQKITFSAEGIAVQKGRMTGFFPYTALTHREESVHFFFFDFGAELRLCVPRRALKAWQITALQNLG